MKSIDIRSESAIKLLAEFLDMDAPYIPGERHVNAEHFAHGSSALFHPHHGLNLTAYFIQRYTVIYAPLIEISVYTTRSCRYARLPQRSVHIADHPKYDTPEGIHPPPSYERTRRWEPGPSRSRSPGPRQSRSHSNYPPGRERIQRCDLSPPPGALPRDNDSRRSTSPYRAAAAEDPSVRRRVRSRASEMVDGRGVRSRSRSPPCIDPKGKGRATSSRSPSPSPKTDEVISLTSHHERGTSSETPASLLRSPSLDRDIPYSEPTTFQTPSRDGRPEEASPPSPGNNNPVIPPQPHDGPAGTTHSTESAPLPSESRQPFNLSVTGPSNTPESYDPPTIKDNPARSNPARRPRYRNQRDSINAYLRSSSTSIPRFPTAIQPALLRSPISGIAEVMVTKIDGLEAVSSATEGQGGDEGGYARLGPEQPERRPSPSVNDYSSVTKETAATRAQSSGAFPTISQLPHDEGR